MQYSPENLTWRFADEDDVQLYFDWANEEVVRKNAFHSDPILFEHHQRWFKSRINSNSLMVIFFHDSTPVGQVRVDWDGDKGVIDYSVDQRYRGRHIGTSMLITVVDIVKKKGSQGVLCAIVKVDNLASIRAFENSGFHLTGRKSVNSMESFEYQYYFNR